MWAGIASSARELFEKSSTVEPNVLIGSACTIMKGSVIPEFSRMPAEECLNKTLEL